MAMTKNQQRAVLGSIVASGTDDLNMMFLSFTMASIMADFSLTGAQGGAIGTITNLGMLLGGLFFGVLGDRYNKLTMLKITLLIFSLSTIGIAFSTGLTMIYALRFIAGIGIGGEYGVALSIMANIVPSEKMGRVSSFNGIAGQVGSIGSALLAGIFLSALGWRGLFLFGALPLVIVAYLQFFVRDEVSFHPIKIEKEAVEKPKISILFKTPKVAYQTLVLMVMSTIQIAGYFGMMNWLPTIIRKQTGLSMGNSSFWMISTIIGMSLGMIVFGRCLDHFGPRIMFGIFLCSSVVFVYIFTFVRTSGQMLFAGAVMGFFVNGMFPGYGAVVSRLYDRQVQAIANNVILNVGRAVGGFSSVVIGMIMESGGVRVVMLFLGGLYLISLGAMLTLPQLKRSNYQQTSHQEPLNLAMEEQMSQI